MAKKSLNSAGVIETVENVNNEFADKLKEGKKSSGLDAAKKFIEAKFEAEKKVVFIAKDLEIIDLSMYDIKDVRIERELAKYQAIGGFELGKLQHWDVKTRIGVVLKRAS
jgi:hypothetical protein